MVTEQIIFHALNKTSQESISASGVTWVQTPDIKEHARLFKPEQLRSQGPVVLTCSAMLDAIGDGIDTLDPNWLLGLNIPTFLLLNMQLAIGSGDPRYYQWEYQERADRVFRYFDLYQYKNRLDTTRLYPFDQLLPLYKNNPDGQAFLDQFANAASVPHTGCDRLTFQSGSLFAAYQYRILYPEAVEFVNALSI